MLAHAPVLCLRSRQAKPAAALKVCFGLLLDSAAPDPSCLQSKLKPASTGNLMHFVEARLVDNLDLERKRALLQTDTEVLVLALHFADLPSLSTLHAPPVLTHTLHDRCLAVWR